MNINELLETNIANMTIAELINTLEENDIVTFTTVITDSKRFSIYPLKVDSEFLESYRQQPTRFEMGRKDKTSNDNNQK